MLAKAIALTLRLLALTSALKVQAAENAKIHKVLPHYLNLEGRNSLSPSLYERDAYQAFLRKHPEEQSALQFDIQWKAKIPASEPIRLRLEVRTSKAHFVRPLVMEKEVKATRWFSSWSALTIRGDEFKQMGEIVAWRASLWSRDRQLAEQRSFLW